MIPYDKGKGKAPTDQQQPRIKWDAVQDAQQIRSDLTLGESLALQGRSSDLHRSSDPARPQEEHGMKP